MTLPASSASPSALELRDASACSVIMCARLFVQWYRSTSPGWFAANSLHWPAANAANTYSQQQLVQVIFKLWKDVFNVHQTCSYSDLSSTCQVWHMQAVLAVIVKQDVSHHLMLSTFAGCLSCLLFFFLSLNLLKACSHYNECSL